MNTHPSRLISPITVQASCTIVHPWLMNGDIIIIRWFLQKPSLPKLSKNASGITKQREWVTLMALICVHHICTMVSHIYAPCFATLALVESVGGPYMQDLTFYLAITPTFSSAMPRCLHGNINILQTDRSWFNICLPSLLSSSRNSKYLVVKIDWQRLATAWTAVFSKHSTGVSF